MCYNPGEHFVICTMSTHDVCVRLRSFISFWAFALSLCSDASLTLLTVQRRSVKRVTPISILRLLFTELLFSFSSKLYSYSVYCLVFVCFTFHVSVYSGTSNIKHRPPTPPIKRVFFFKFINRCVACARRLPPPLCLVCYLYIFE